MLQSVVRRVGSSLVASARGFVSSSHAPAAVAAASAQTGKMFCFQCEQTEKVQACTTAGVCGKTPTVAWTQDLLVEQLKNVAGYATAARAAKGTVPASVNKFIMDGMFATLTNVNFDQARFVTYVSEAVQVEADARQAYVNACKKSSIQPSLALPRKVDLSLDLEAQGRAYGVLARRDAIGNADLASLVELCTYGLKGACAYAEHASQMGFEDETIHAKLQGHLANLSLEAAPKQSMDALLTMALDIGATNASVMAMLDQAHTATFGHPVPTKVSTTPVAGKAIVVSGHDMPDLKRLLEMTKGTGINVYTHGEMLPAHGYPKLKEHAHLVGHYGGAWQQQAFDFSAFPGAILMTTNCIIEPRKAYKDRIFTTNAVGFAGVRHVKNRSFEPVIERALACEGFSAAPEHETQTHVMTGFGHNAVLGLASTIVDLVKAGKISRFFFIGGCDGSETERSYFTKLAKQTPRDSVILTAGCGKMRFNKLDLGTIANTGLPRMLDMGQCNDSFGAVKVAMALADAFKTDVNGLPLSFAVSWFEQKAVAVLLTLLALNVKNIRLGPRLPAFITPNVLNVLVNRWNIMPIGEPAKDLAAMMSGK